jgi:hypothetical protein
VGRGATALGVELKLLPPSRKIFIKGIFMPSKSLKQHRIMCMAAHGKDVGIPKSVGEEFCSSDRGKKFKTIKKLGKRG